MLLYAFTLFAILVDFLCIRFLRKEWSRPEAIVNIISLAIDALGVLVLRRFLIEQRGRNGVVDFLREWQLDPFFAFRHGSLALFEWPAEWWSGKYVVLFLLVDFCYYWIHRVNHEFEIFWASHAVHHSTTSLNFLATQRNPIRFITLSWPLVILSLGAIAGFSLFETFFAFACIQCLQTLIHSEWIPRLPRPLERVLNTPWHHRIHHSVDLEGRTGNYGGVLIVFDRIFGTLVEVPDRKFAYGTRGFPVTQSFVKLNIQYWVDLAKRTWATGSPIRAFCLLFVPISLHPERNFRVDVRQLTKHPAQANFKEREFIYENSTSAVEE